MKYFFIIFCLLSFCSAFSQNEIPADSVDYMLQEVVIKGPAVIRKPDKNIYTIDESIIRRSSSTVDLIRNLQIPELSVNEVMQKITSALGTVQIRVNGRETSYQRLLAIDFTTIDKVEWITDPGLRYGTDVATVLNIIVKNPTSGGSLILNATEGLTHFFHNSNENLTINYGASQWNFGSWQAFRHNLEIFREYNDAYRLSNGQIIKRIQQPDPGRFDQRNFAPMISYNYLKSDSINFFVGLSNDGPSYQYYIFNGTVSDLSSTTGYQTLISESEKDNDNSPLLNIYWEQKLPRRNSIVFNALAQFSTSKSNRSYHETDIAQETQLIDIDNNIKSKGFYYSIEANHIKDWEQKGQLTSGFKYNHNDSRSTYLDFDNTFQRQSTDKFYFFSEYMRSIRKLTFRAGLGATYNSYSNKENNISNSSFDFTPSISLDWRASSKSRWSATYSNRVTTPALSQTSNVEQDIDGFQIERGNPELRSYLTHFFRLRYGFYNGNNFNLTLSTNLVHSRHPIQTFYSWDGDKILRSYSNDGFYSGIGVDLSLSWEAISDWMDISGTLGFERQWNRGKGFAHKILGFGQDFTLTAYHWNFSFFIQIQNPAKDLWMETVTLGERFNIVGLSYNWRNWDFGVMMFMPVGRYRQSTEIISEIVNQKTILRSKSVEHMPLIKIAYNMNWGHQKKAVQRRLNDSGEATKTKAAGR